MAVLNPFFGVLSLRCGTKILAITQIILSSITLIFLLEAIGSLALCELFMCIEHFVESLEGGDGRRGYDEDRYGGDKPLITTISPYVIYGYNPMGLLLLSGLLFCITIAKIVFSSLLKTSGPKRRVNRRCIMWLVFHLIWLCFGIPRFLLSILGVYLTDVHTLVQFPPLAVPEFGIASLFVQTLDLAEVIYGIWIVYAFMEFVKSDDKWDDRELEAIRGIGPWNWNQVAPAPSTVLAYAPGTGPPPPVAAPNVPPPPPPIKV